MLKRVAHRVTLFLLCARQRILGGEFFFNKSSVCPMRGSTSRTARMASVKSYLKEAEGKALA